MDNLLNDSIFIDIRNKYINEDSPLGDFLKDIETCHTILFRNLQELKHFIYGHDYYWCYEPYKRLNRLYKYRQKK